MGERLGRYVVLKHLASGGMADVLLARTDGIERFERHVVLKRIRAEHAKDQRFIDMFLDEARLAANLHHQNIVQVHDIGESAGEYFFAMEYIHGEDLRSMLSAVAKTRTHMPLGYVIAIISAAAAGLHYAHERRGPDKKPLNIVHRDVSPSNILVAYDGAVKLVDFGIAKAAMRQVETRSGSLKGKVSYMSPEHCKMVPIDRRSDVYALGVVLYELATTTRLFKSDSDYLVMDAICTGKIPLPRVRRPDLPNELQSIIMRALATDPDTRYQTADELRTALDQFANQHGLTANNASVAGYMNKLFGEKPEPWLENTVTDVASPAFADTLAGETSNLSDMARRSWTEMPRVEAEDAKTTTDGKGRFKPTVQAAVEPAGDRIAPPVDGTSTSTKMGWEAAASLPPAPRGRGFSAGKAAMFAVPLLAIGALAVWQLQGSSAPSPAPAAASMTPPVAAPVAVTPPPPPPTAVAAVAPVAPPIEPAPVDKTVARQPGPAKKALPAPTKGLARVDKTAAKVATTPIKSAPPTPAKTAAPTAAPATPVAPPVAAPPPPVQVATPAPAQVETQMAVVSPGAVEQVASTNRRMLAKCEGTDEMHGEVTVKFEVNAAGRVVKSQMSSTVKNAKVAGCILRAVQSWQFPKPATGSAKGVYTIAYQ